MFITLRNYNLYLLSSKSCPFCKVEMIRPRKGIWGNKGEPFYTFSCDRFRTKDDGHSCEYCKSYYDYECPSCHVLLLYSS
jgi:hypothetical protein